jgi:branched-chain amino acid transport system substrate-binding protein
MKLKWSLAPTVLAVLLLVAHVALPQGRLTANYIGTMAVLTDLTSYTAEYGQQELAGLQVLADELRSAGGGRALQLDTQDTKSDPKEAINGLNQILSKGNKPPLLFSAMSSVSTAVLPLADRNGMLTLCDATTGALLQVSRNSIRNFPSPSQEFASLYEGAVLPLKVKKLAILYVNDEYGQAMVSLFRQRTTGGSGPSATVAEGYGYEASDFRPSIASTIAAGSDGVIAVGYGSQAGSLIRQLRENGFKGWIFVPSLIVNTDSVSTSAGTALTGVIFNGFDYQNDDPATGAFLARFAQKYKGRQSDIGVLAYVGAKIIIEHMTQGATPAETIEALQAAQPFKTVLGEVGFRDRSFIYPLKLYEASASGIVPFKAP